LYAVIPKKTAIFHSWESVFRTLISSWLIFSQLSFGRKLATLLKIVHMKAIIQFLYSLASLTFSKEKMSALIPVRVETKIHPDHR